MLQKIINIFVVVCLFLTALILSMAVACPLSREVASVQSAKPERITIISIHAPNDLFPGNSWIVDYLSNGDARPPIYAPSSEHIDRLIRLWESEGREVSWLGVAE